MIEVRRTTIVVHNYKLGDNKKLERFLTIFREFQSGHKTPKFYGYFYDEEKEELYIPRGYHIYRLQSILGDKDKIVWNNDSDPYQKILLNLKVQPRDEIQKDAIKFLTEKDKSLLVSNFHQKFLSLSTGMGKTYLLINTICYYKRRAIILVDTLNIAEQWKESFLKFTDIKENQICIISGTPKINKILKESDLKLNYKIYICMEQTLSSVIKQNPSKVTELFNKIKVGIKVYDEAHTSWAALVKIDSLTNTYKNFYLTATPGRSDPLENRLYNYIFESVPLYGRDKNIESYKYTSKEVEKDKAYHKIYYIKYDTEPSYNDQVDMNKRDMFDLNLFSDYLRNKKYNKFMYVLIKLIDICLSEKSERKIAILLIKNDMIQQVYETLKEIYPDIEIGRFCGLVKKEEKQGELDKRIILSTEKSLGKAIDIKNLGFLINSIPYSSPIIAEQMIGRLRRNAKTSYYFDMADIGFKQGLVSQKNRAKSYTKIAKEVKQCQFTPEMLKDEIVDAYIEERKG